jgi:hypothetical protein
VGDHGRLGPPPGLESASGARVAADHGAYVVGRFVLSALRVRALRIGVCLAVLAMTAAFALVVVVQSDASLGAAYIATGHAQARGLARSFVLRSQDLSYADLGTRLEQLRDRADGVTRVDAFAIGESEPQKIATTDPRTLVDNAGPLELAALRDGRPRFRNIQLHGRHLLEYVFALSEHGRRFGGIAIYFDLAPLDRAQADARPRPRRTRAPRRHPHRRPRDQAGTLASRHAAQQMAHALAPFHGLSALRGPPLARPGYPA